MGSSSSTPRDAQSKAESRRREELEKRGILVPPVFAIPSPNVPLSPAVQERLNRTVGFPEGPSCLEYLHQSDPAMRIRQDFLQTGFWIHAGQHVRASLVQQQQQQQQQDNDASVRVHGRIKVERALDAASSLTLTGGSDSLPSIRYRRAFGEWGSVITEANTQGKAWLGANLFHVLQIPQPLQIQLGSWVILSGSQQQKDQQQKSKVTQESIHGYGMMDFLGATAAVEASFHKPTEKFQTRSYLSVNLSDDTPLYLTLEQGSSGSQQTTSMSLSQTLHLDRSQLNPLEDRAPTVRNRLAWALSMHRNDTETDVAVAGAWQINRAVALKCVIQPNSSEITSALILKRWREPRLTCSLQYKTNSKTAGSWGIGLELETDPSGDSPAQYYEDWEGGRSSQGNQSVPETRATLDGKL